MTATFSVVIVPCIGDEAGTGQAAQSAMRRLGMLVPLTAPPIHAVRALESQALTGLGCGAIGVFDDWRPEGYGAVPVTDGVPPNVASLVEVARQAGLPILDGLRDSAHVSIPSIVRIHPGDEKGIEAAILALAGSSTTVWLVVCETHHAERVLNPNALLVATHLLEVDSSGRPDWRRSLAYHIGHGQLWVNLRGREPEGVVRPGEEYDEVRQMVRALLAERLVDPGSGQLIAEVLLKEEVYEGRWLPTAPDLVVAPTRGYAFSPAAVAGHIEAEPVRGAEGTACRPGWWGVTGPAARREGALPPVEITQIAPTLAAAFGLSLRSPVSGRIRKDLFSDEFWAGRPTSLPSRQTGLTPTEEQLLTRRLQELGYIE